MELTDILLVILTGAILVTGGIFYLWLQELRGCEEKLIAYYKINRSLGMFDFVNESGPNTPAGTPREAMKSIVFSEVDDNVSRILECQAKKSFTMEEWEACNRIVRKAPA